MIKVQGDVCTLCHGTASYYLLLSAVFVMTGSGQGLLGVMMVRFQCINFDDVYI